MKMGTGNGMILSWQKNLKVERTSPGSKNKYKITYHDGQEKWTDNYPGDGEPGPYERRKDRRKQSRPSIKDAKGTLGTAVRKYVDGGDKSVLVQAVDDVIVHVGREVAREVIRGYLKDHKEGAEGKTAEAHEIIRQRQLDKLRNKKAMTTRISGIVEKIAFSGNSTAYPLKDGMSAEAFRKLALELASESKGEAERIAKVLDGVCKKIKSEYPDVSIEYRPDDFNKGPIRAESLRIFTNGKVSDVNTRMSCNLVVGTGWPIYNFSITIQCSYDVTGDYNGAEVKRGKYTVYVINYNFSSIFREVVGNLPSVGGLAKNVMDAMEKDGTVMEILHPEKFKSNDLTIGVVYDWVKKQNTWFDWEVDKDLSGTSREYGDVGSETPGAEDRKEANRLSHLIKEEFGDKVTVEVESVDEWVDITVKINKTIRKAGDTRGDSAKGIATDIVTRIEEGRSVPDAFKDIGLVKLWYHTRASDVPIGFNDFDRDKKIMVYTVVIEKAMKRLERKAGKVAGEEEVAVMAEQARGTLRAIGSALGKAFGRNWVPEKILPLRDSVIVKLKSFKKGTEQFQPVAGYVLRYNPGMDTYLLSPFVTVEHVQFNGNPVSGFHVDDLGDVGKMAGIFAGLKKTYEMVEMAYGDREAAIVARMVKGEFPPLEVVEARIQKVQGFVEALKRIPGVESSVLSDRTRTCDSADVIIGLKVKEFFSPGYPFNRAVKEFEVDPQQVFKGIVLALHLKDDLGMTGSTKPKKTYKTTTFDGKRDTYFAGYDRAYISVDLWAR